MSAGNNNKKRVLETALGKLLGFEDGEAEDLLEHLFGIESEDDLSEYLVQLLGGETPEVLDFVDNVSRYRRGETLNTDDDADAKEATVDDAASQQTAALDSFRALALENSSAKTLKKDPAKKQATKSRVPPPKKTNNRKKSPPAESSSSSTNNNSNRNAKTEPQNGSKPQKSTAQTQKQEAEAVKKFHPSRGKAEVVCGCFGTKHKALTNCLYCGRISCEAEGYGFCPFCGLMVEAGVAGGNEKAYQQKERLLRFDRDFARRTEVFDDQADYQGPATWMTQEEEEEAEENEQKHLESLKRPKQTLTLAI